MVARIASILAAVFTLAACNIDAGKFEDRGCMTDGECRPDQACVKGLCAQLNCTAPADCGPGFQYDCQAGLCVATACTGADGECAIGYQCNVNGFCSLECAGADMDLDGVCDTVDNCIAISNRNQTDADGDQKGDACDVCPNDPDNDIDGDEVCGDIDNCIAVPNTNQFDRDTDGMGDECDADDDNDGVADGVDTSPLDPKACGDSDGDTCDDCAGNTTAPGDGFGPLSDFNPTEDGVDFDHDGQCDAGDADDDNDGVADAVDQCPRGDTGWVSDASTDVDGDGCQDAAEDTDDDNDGVLDVADIAPANNRVCGDSDNDNCDDCAVGVDGFGPLADKQPGNDGLDTDSDGLCNNGDNDDDGDTIADGLDTDPLDRFKCQNSDGDGCDDCAVTGGPPSATNDGLDTDGDGQCNASDTDDDNDGVADVQDVAPTNRFACRDGDGDTCDDCGVTGGPPAITNDGADFDGDGQCDQGDTDDDNDGVADAVDSDPKDRFKCRDGDGDTCDDCSVTGGPPAIGNDGVDSDADGICNTGDTDDDNDTVPDSVDADPLNKNICRDTDSDGCDDCAVTGGPPSTSNDGIDSDSDGICNAGDTDDDNDTIIDTQDNAPTNRFKCRDLDNDTCDDCAVTGGPPDPANDGTDTDGDGACNAGDPDDDNDTVVDTADVNPLDKFACRDADGDTCDDCVVAGSPNTTNDGLDSDTDGLCNTGDPDDDNDGVADAQDVDPLNRFACRDADNDTCDDCSVTGGPPSATNDGLDTDGDGKCNAGDPDDDNDTVLDGVDVSPLDNHRCRDADNDTCDDCSVTGGPPNTANDGPDANADGICDVSDPDVDGDTVPNSQDIAPTDNTRCQDLDNDGCDDCTNGRNAANPPSTTNDGTDTDADGKCNTGDPDDDNDGIVDGSDPFPTDNKKCGDSDADTCDDCAVGVDGFGPAPDQSPNNDGLDTDGDGKCNAGDPDDDNDTILDGADTDPVNKFKCRDQDADSCDDCAVTGGPPSTTNDGTDTDSDGACNAGDFDDDNDGVADTIDSNTLDPHICGKDVDSDSCDDCAVGVDGFGPLADNVPANDGLDTDGDGKCNAGDPDDDNDTVTDILDSAPLDKFKCQDADTDTCDDCAVTGGPPATGNDGTDTDSDGKCNAGDPDDDNDTVADGQDNTPLDKFKCRDLDVDACDDCSVTGGPPSTSNDGTDTDGDGLCNAGDADDDNDGVTDASDTASLNPDICRDSDNDTCDDCAIGTDNFGAQSDAVPTNDGTDTDGDGLCNAGDPDDDNDGVADATDTNPLNRFICADTDLDTCDDCSVTGGPASITNDGPDADGDGICDAGEQCNEEIAFIAAGAQVTASTDAATLTPVIPAATAGDFAIVILAGRPEDNSTDPAAPSGWTKRAGGSFVSVSGEDLKVILYFKFLVANEPDPVFTLPATWTSSTGNTAGASAQVVVYSGVDIRSPFDVTDAPGSAATAAQTFTPPSISTVTNGGIVVSVVATSDDNALNLSNARSFTLRMSGTSYDTGTGTDHSVGLADASRVIAGGITMPTWNQTVNQTDSWVSITFALRPTNGKVCTGIVDLAAGGDHTCAIYAVDKVRCWGANAVGQLGYGNTTKIGDTEAPNTVGPVNVGASVVGLALGLEHTCALTSTGTVRCWGRSDAGQLGYGSTASLGDAAGEMPTANVSLGTGASGTAVAVVAGDKHTCMLNQSGKVKCWGSGANGRLGYGNTTNVGCGGTCTAMPPAEVTLTSGSERVNQLVAGDAHNCVLLSTGKVRCWGLNDAGQLGYGNTTSVGCGTGCGAMPPADVNLGTGTVVELAAGGKFTCARFSTGAVKCWGAGALGQLGNNNTNNIGDASNEMPPNDVDVGGTVSQITAGTNHVCVRLTTAQDGGAVRCWGDGTSGKLGYGNTNTIGDNEAPSAAGDVPIRRAAVKVITGSNLTCALEDVGGVQCWGENANGALGYSSTADIGDSEFLTSIGFVPIE